jgi:hypothetical protein
MLAVELIKEWINALPDDMGVGVDEGGLCLVTEDGQNVLEIGGIPEEN